MITNEERTYLRELARRVADLAAQPVMAQRREKWKQHNSLRTAEPLLLVFPEGSWRELLPESALRCVDREARGTERALRMRLYYPEHFADDTVIEKIWPVQASIRHTGWGLEPKRVPSTTAHGAWKFVAVVNEPADMKKLRLQEVIYDEAETKHNLQAMQELFGDILDVQYKGVPRLSFHFMKIWTDLRGLEETMSDMVENPEWLHEAMGFLEEGYRGMLRTYLELNLLRLNNDMTYSGSGGNGYTDDLPAPGFDPNRVRPCDMWSAAESQETAQISPAHYREFIWPYEQRMLEPWGLNAYGCCESLTHKLDLVCALPRIRRISIAPWSDVDVCAKKLGNRYIFSWKPNPATLVGAFDEEYIRRYIRKTLEATRGCVVEMVLKDTHTVENEPRRMDRWLQIAREEIERAKDRP